MKAAKESVGVSTKKARTYDNKAMLYGQFVKVGSMLLMYTGIYRQQVNAVQTVCKGRDNFSCNTIISFL